MRVLILLGVIAAAASAAKSSDGSSSLKAHCYAPPPSETFEHYCRNTSMAELEVLVIDACKAYAKAPADARRLAEEDGDDLLYNSSVKICNSTLNKKGDGFTVADVEVDREDLWTTWKKEFCFDICPFIGSGKRRCDAGGDCGGHHTTIEPTKRNYLQFNVFFLFMAIAIGAPRNSPRNFGAIRRDSRTSHRSAPRYRRRVQAVVPAVGAIHRRLADHRHRRWPPLRGPRRKPALPVARAHVLRRRPRRQHQPGGVRALQV